jgi:hypothetical protein
MMKIWYKDPIYVILHVLSGALAYFYPILLVPIVGYHALQYVMGVRFFGFQGEIRPGNSLEHTAVKLLEVGAGYLTAYLVSTQ